MTEPIDKWREEFEAIFGPHAKYENGKYVANFDQWHWQGFIMAKRSTPVVELPKLESKTVDEYYLGQNDYCVKVFGALTAAGINYRIKGE